MRTMTTRGRALRRAAHAVVVGGLVAASVACTPELPSPAPTITSATATPGVAGQPITFTIVGTHPAIAPNYLSFAGAVGPSKATLPRSFEPDACFPADAQFPTTNAPGEATLVFTCTLPTTTLNGNWTLTVWVGSNGFAGRRITIPFSVTGGVGDDLVGPTVTVLTPQPQTVARGSTFSIRYRIEDPHLAPNTGLRADTFEHSGLFVPYSNFSCYIFVGDDFQLDVISPTVMEASYTCKVPASGIELGQYTSFPQFATDIYGFATHIPLVLTVT